MYRIYIGLSCCIILSCNRTQLSDRESAGNAAKEAILTQLKAPATAKFASLNLTETNGDKYIIFAAVDSQNEYAAFLRSNYLVAVKKTEHGFLVDRHNGMLECPNPPKEYHLKTLRQLNDWPNEVQVQANLAAPPLPGPVFDTVIGPKEIDPASDSCIYQCFQYTYYAVSAWSYKEEQAGRIYPPGDTVVQTTREHGARCANKCTAKHEDACRVIASHHRSCLADKIEDFATEVICDTIAMHGVKYCCNHQQFTDKICNYTQGVWAFRAKAAPLLL